MDRERMMTEAWSVTQEILSLAELNSNTKQNRDGVEMVQRRAARFVLNCYERTTSVTKMLKQLDWETFELRRKRARLTMLHKMHCNLVVIDQQKYLEPAGRLIQQAYAQTLV